MKRTLKLHRMLFALLTLAPGVASAATFFGPTAYLSSAAIPAGLYSAGPLFLETFEDGTLDGGITASAGSVIPPGFPGLIDSVDADDGSIDGSGLGGHSWFSGSGATGVKFFFPAGTTAAGLVWTDGAGTVTFAAFAPGGAPLGVVGPLSGIPDGSFGGTTGEDRFFGVSSLGGVGSILIMNSSGGIEVDHVQYGSAFVPAVPDTAGSLGLLGLGLMSLAGCRAKPEFRLGARRV